MPESNAARRTRLERIRKEAFERDGVIDMGGRIPEIKEGWERICSFCEIIQPCTPEDLPCTGCGHNLAGSKVIKSSRQFTNRGNY